VGGEGDFCGMVDAAGGREERKKLRRTIHENKWSNPQGKNEVSPGFGGWTHRRRKPAWAGGVYLG